MTFVGSYPTLYEKWKQKVEAEKTAKMYVIQNLQKNAVALKDAATELFKQGQFEQAIQKYSEALEVCPLKDKTTTTALYNNISECYLQLVSK